MFSCRWTTRGYELDAEGLIPAPTLLRYAEQIRWEAYRARAAEFDGVAAGARSFVIAAEKLEVVSQLSYGVELEGLFWLARVGRTSLDFINIIRRAADGETVARVRVIAVHIGLDRRPATVPDSLRSLAQGELDETFAFLPPLEGEAPPTAVRDGVAARFSDMDLMQHVNHANYLAYFDDARRAAVGAPWDAGGRIIKASIDYREQAVAGEQLTCALWPVAGPTLLGGELRRETDGTAVCRVHAQLAAAAVPPTSAAGDL